MANVAAATEISKAKDLDMFAGAFFDSFFIVFSQFSDQNDLS